MKDLASITATVLAGGLGTRLRSVVTDRPKVLAEVKGRPFLSYLLDQLESVGIRDVVLCTGYMGDRIRETYGNRYGTLSLVYSQESSPLGTGGALRLALPLMRSDTVLIMNGDSLCTVDLKAFWDWHRARAAQATVVLAEVPDTGRFGRVQVDPHGRIFRFDEKDGSQGPGWINAGVYMVARPLLETIPATGLVSLERDMFPAWIPQRFYGYQSRGPFLDIGTPEAYELVAHVVPQGAPDKKKMVLADHERR